MRDTDHWQHIGEHWSRERPARLWRVHADAVNRRWIASNLGDWAKGPMLKTDLFDEAAGDGLLTMVCRDGDGTRVGIDVAAAVVRAASTRNPSIHALRADVRRLPFANNSFAWVLSDSTLDHFHCGDDLSLSLREIHRVLAPGGRLLVTMDNLANPAIALRNALPFPWLYRTGIVPYFVGVATGPGRLRELLEEAGFHVEKSDALMHCLRVLAVPMSTVVDRLGRPWLNRAWLRLLMSCEWLENTPLRYRTGYFVAMVARKP